MAIVRSLAHESSDHFVGTALDPDRLPVEPSEQQKNERPSVGSIVAKLRGPNGPGVPPYVAMVGGVFGGLFEGGAYLGPGLQPVQPQRRPHGEHAGPQPRAGQRPHARPPGGPPLPALEARQDQPPPRHLGHDGRARQVHCPGLRDGHRPLGPQGARPARARTPGSATATAATGSARAACWPAGWSRPA